MRKLILIAAAGSALSLCGCSIDQSHPGNPTNILATSDSLIITSLPQAEAVTNAIYNFTDGLVNAGVFKPAQLDTLQAARSTLTGEMHKLRAARDAGQPMTFTAVTAAIQQILALVGNKTAS